MENCIEYAYDVSLGNSPQVPLFRAWVLNPGVHGDHKNYRGKLLDSLSVMGSVVNIF
jgi:hypothetical protein